MVEFLGRIVDADQFVVVLERVPDHAKPVGVAKLLGLVPLVGRQLDVVATGVAFDLDTTDLDDARGKVDHRWARMSNPRSFLWPTRSIFSLGNPSTTSSVDHDVLGPQLLLLPHFGVVSRAHRPSCAATLSSAVTTMPLPGV